MARRMRAAGEKAGRNTGQAGRLRYTGAEFLRAAALGRFCEAIPPKP